jgi:hypothetical protein
MLHFRQNPVSGQFSDRQQFPVRAFFSGLA